MWINRNRRRGKDFFFWFYFWDTNHKKNCTQQQNKNQYYRPTEPKATAKEKKKRVNNDNKTENQNVLSYCVKTLHFSFGWLQVKCMLSAANTLSPIETYDIKWLYICTHTLPIQCFPTTWLIVYVKRTVKFTGCRSFSHWILSIKQNTKVTFIHCIRRLFLIFK